MLRSTKGRELEEGKRYASTLCMPLVLRGQKGKEIICKARPRLTCQRSADSNDSFSTKNWYIEYHPTLPQVMPSKGCIVSNHGNAGPCYLCHHGNMISSHNGCIKYGPIQVAARYNGMCYCMLCQQRSAAIVCNCQSCLSLRFEQTAASVLGPSEKSIQANPGLCCGRMKCERIEQIKYDYCQCAQCMEKISRDNTKFHCHIHPMEIQDTPKMHIPKIPVMQHDTRDQNNNENQIEENLSKNKPNAEDSKTALSNDHENSGGEVKTNENYNNNIWTSNLRKRKHQESEEVLVNSKPIKTEIPDIETPCEHNGLSDTIRDKKGIEDIDVLHVKQSNEERDIEHMNKGAEGFTRDTKDNRCVIKSSINVFPCQENGINLDDKKQTEIRMDKNHNHGQNNSRGRGRRHYNTRLTTTKPNGFGTDFVVPTTSEWKEGKEIYSEISKSRQRSKLNRLLANEHERRRVAQLNSAYQDLRQLIPGYQCDTKLPKIKILRYAINYIAHLDNILEVDGDK